MNKRLYDILIYILRRKVSKMYIRMIGYIFPCIYISMVLFQPTNWILSTPLNEILSENLFCKRNFYYCGFKIIRYHTIFPYIRIILKFIFCKGLKVIMTNDFKVQSHDFHRVMISSSIQSPLSVLYQVESVHIHSYEPGVFLQEFWLLGHAVFEPFTVHSSISTHWSFSFWN